MDVKLPPHKLNFILPQNCYSSNTSVMGFSRYPLINNKVYTLTHHKATALSSRNIPNTRYGLHLGWAQIEVKCVANSTPTEKEKYVNKYINKYRNLTFQVMRLTDSLLVHSYQNLSNILGLV